MSEKMIKGSTVFLGIVTLTVLLLLNINVVGQKIESKPQWIRPETAQSQPVWGIKGGMVLSLWPTSIDVSRRNKIGGPRGLLRIGYNFKNITYLLNFIAIEPVVNGKMEFSEISPSRVDGKIGKLIWAGSNIMGSKYFPIALTRGEITHPDPTHPEVEQLSFYLFIEKFLNGAHPYLKVSIRSDSPQEIGFQIFNFKDSAPMDRCALTATMGNYSRLRLLYLKDRIVDSRVLYKGYSGLDFIEKKSYPFNELLKDGDGDFIVMATSNESFDQLSSWPQKKKYLDEPHWRYSPFFKVTQYWKKDHERFDSSLHVRVNGRAKYWSGGSRNSDDYLDIPGGPTFENFEMREKYYPGEKFYFGITRKTPEEMNIQLPYNSSQ